MRAMENRLTTLQHMQETLLTTPEVFYKDYKTKFWKIVGQIKRESVSNPQEIEIASDIRDIMYTKRLGQAKPLVPWVPVLVIIGITFFLVSIVISIESLTVLAMIFSWVMYSLFMWMFFQLVHVKKRTQLVMFLLTVGTLIIFDVITYFSSRDLLFSVNQYFHFAAVPCLYPMGRWIGGKIGGIQFDGISPDIFGLYTLKINYVSYLTASPPKRQWIFLCGGLGTVTVCLLGALVSLFVYGNPWFFLVPILLFLAEIMDYLNLAGALSGGEFHHLRREHRIIRDWLQLQKQTPLKN